MIAAKYRVERVLGSGGMGVVVAATHVELEMPRAIKLLLPEALDHPKAAERFLREARAACALESEHVARVLDVGKHEDMPFMVMEYLDGSDLRQLLERRGKFPVGEAVHFVLQACDALAEAHGLGIVHRDIKPANLFLAHRKGREPCLKVLDFGVAKAMEAQSRHAHGLQTTTGQMLGTPYFMSPEQVNSERDLDARSDIWGVGVMLYLFVTGWFPFKPMNEAAGTRLYPVLSSIVTADPISPMQFNPSLPPGLEAVLLRCLAKNRVDRYPDVAELASALLPFAPEAAAPLVARIRRVLDARPARPPQMSLPEEQPDAPAAPLSRTLTAPGPFQSTGPAGDHEGEASAVPELPQPTTPTGDGLAPQVDKSTGTLTNTTLDGARAESAVPVARRRRWPVIAGVLGLAAVAGTVTVGLVPTASAPASVGSARSGMKAVTDALARPRAGAEPASSATPAPATPPSEPAALSTTVVAPPAVPTPTRPQPWQPPTAKSAAPVGASSAGQTTIGDQIPVYPFGK